MTAPPPAPPRGPLVLLGLLSVVTFAGPFVIYLVVRGGRSPDWPPDRPVEWWTFGLSCGAVVALMLGCVASGLRAKPRARPGGGPG